MDISHDMNKKNIINQKKKKTIITCRQNLKIAYFLGYGVCIV